MIFVILVSTLEKYLIMAGILLLLYLAYKNHKENEQIISVQPDQLDVIDNNELDQFRALYEITKKKVDIKYQTMREMDIRQFQGRKDVTIDEVVNYMIEKSQCIGLEKRSYQMQRITQVCNLTEEDMKEVFHRIWGKCKINEDIEAQKVADYMFKEGKKLYDSDDHKCIARQMKEYELSVRGDTQEKRDELEKWLPEEKLKNLEEKEYWDKEDIHRYYDYEEWLKKKGYIK